MGDIYKLQALLGIREQEQLDAEQNYAREVQELSRRERVVEAKQDALKACIDARKQACIAHDKRRLSGEATMIEIHSFDTFLAGLKIDADRVRVEITEVQAEREQQRVVVARAKDALIEASKELKAVQKHHNKWQKEQAAEAARRDSAAMDEVAARLWAEHKR